MIKDHKCISEEKFCGSWSKNRQHTKSQTIIKANHMTPTIPGFFAEMGRDIRLGARNFSANIKHAFTSPEHLLDNLKPEILNTKLQVMAHAQSKIPCALNQTIPAFGKTPDIKVAASGIDGLIVALNPDDAEPVFQLAHPVAWQAPSSENHSNIYIITNSDFSTSNKRALTIIENRATTYAVRLALKHALNATGLQDKDLRKCCFNINNGSFQMTLEQIESFAMNGDLTHNTIDRVHDFVAAINTTNTNYHTSLMNMGAWFKRLDVALVTPLVEYMVQAIVNAKIDKEQQHYLAISLGAMLNEYPTMLSIQSKTKLVALLREAEKSSYGLCYGSMRYLGKASHELKTQPTFNLTIRCLKQIQSPANGLKTIASHIERHGGEPIDTEQLTL